MGAMTTRVLLEPHWDKPDAADGGIRRVVEAQRRWLPEFGIDLVPLERVGEAQVIATHAGLWIAPTSKQATVSHCHGLYWAHHEWPKWCHLVNDDVIAAMRRADKVTAPSKWVGHAIERGMWIKPEVLYHGIEPEEWPEGDPSGYVLWNKTRVDPVCDPFPIEELARRRPDSKFVSTFGTAEPGGRNLVVTGALPYSEGREVLLRASVYLSTSRETFGIGTLEAMAAGVPVLGWNWGGQAEIVTHKVHGWLSPPDDYDDLSRGLEWVMQNRASLSKACREHVLTNFTWKQRIEPYARLYEELACLPQSHPKVSVVIPAYNMARSLPKTLESVDVAIGGLDYGEVEVIVVDDASTDDTQTMLKVWATENFVRVIRNETNQYLAETLNIGISAARGRYILCLDADNTIAPDTLQLLADALDANRDIDIAYGSMEVIEPDGRRWVSTWPPQTFSFSDQVVHRNQIPSTCMYRRRTWKRVGGYRARCRTAEDADFWCRATSMGANARKVTDAVTLQYTNRPDSMSHEEPDWAWHSWYPWGKKLDLTPFGAPIPITQMGQWRPPIHTHEFPMVSVVIPVGPGHERLVLDALDSLQAQTFVHWEAVVVNDTGSALPWVHPWAHVVPNLGRAGAGSARNCGVDNSRGILVLFLDADDYLQPNALKAMVEAWRASAQPAKTFVYSDWFVQETGERKEAPEGDCAALLRQQWYPVTCLYPRSLVAKATFDVTLPAWEDWDYQLQIAVAGGCGVRVPQALLQYRIHAGNRREAGYADREQLKVKIYDRWREYIEGEKDMPCGGCGGGHNQTTSLQAGDFFVMDSLGRNIPPPPTEDAVLVEYYTDDYMTTRTFLGKVTGKRYKFGSDNADRVRYVLKPDVTGLVDMMPDSFRVFTPVEAEEPLAAAGPPKRTSGK